MDIRILKNFLGIAKAQSISRASEQLFITQPTLSRQMMELEQELGVRLFYRRSKNRNMVLTEEGKILKKRAEEILILMEKTESQLRNASRELQGDLYIGAAETPAFEWIAKACRIFSRTHPQVRIHLYSANADDVLEKMNNGILDFGLIISKKEIGKYEYLTLPFVDQWGLLVSADSAAAKLSKIRPEDMKQLPLIISEQSESAEPFRGWLKQDLESLNIVCRYNLLYNAAWLAADTKGAVVCLQGMTPAILNNKVQFIPLDPPIQADIRLIWRSSRLLSRQASAFLMEFENLIQQKNQDFCEIHPPFEPEEASQKWTQNSDSGFSGTDSTF